MRIVNRVDDERALLDRQTTREAVVSAKRESPDADFVTEPVPRMTPEKTCAIGLAKMSPALSLMLPTTEPLLVAPSPSCRFPPLIFVPPV